MSLDVDNRVRDVQYFFIYLLHVVPDACISNNDEILQISHIYKPVVVFLQ